MRKESGRANEICDYAVHLRTVKNVCDYYIPYDITLEYLHLQKKMQYAHKD